MDDRILGVRDIEDNYPDQAGHKGGDHERCEPGRALLASLAKMGKLVDVVNGFLFLAHA